MVLARTLAPLGAESQFRHRRAVWNCDARLRGSDGQSLILACTNGTWVSTPR